jgi:hypothetical protein
VSPHDQLRHTSCTSVLHTTAEEMRWQHQAFCANVASQQPQQQLDTQ